MSVAALEKRYRAAHKPHERSWWQILWLLAKEQTATAESTGYTRAWIRQIAKRYNEHGPGSRDRGQRACTTGSTRRFWRAPRMLTAEQQLQQALAGDAPDGSK